MEWSYENVVCKLLPVFSWPSSNQWSSVQLLKHIISQTFQNCLMFSAYKSAILFWQYYNSLLMHSFVMKQFSHGIVPLSNFLQWTWWRKRSEDFFSGTMRPVGVWSFCSNPKSQSQSPIFSVTVTQFHFLSENMQIPIPILPPQAPPHRPGQDLNPQCNLALHSFLPPMPLCLEHWRQSGEKIHCH